MNVILALGNCGSQLLLARVSSIDEVHALERRIQAFDGKKYIVYITSSDRFLGAVKDDVGSLLFMALIAEMLSNGNMSTFSNIK
jgi:hypothetical protein